MKKSEDNEFENEVPTQPIQVLTPEEIEWANLARQRAATRDLRSPQ
jgi:hypothetical protein